MPKQSQRSAPQAGREFAVADRTPTGQFAKGNRLWEARSSHGRKPIFETAEALEDAIQQYFEWVADNPLQEGKLASFQGVHEIVAVPKMRAMTLTGMCLFIGIAFQTWNDWKESRPDFSDVMAWAETVIKTQKFEGAAADLLNPNIIARDLGLVDKTDLNHGGRVEVPITGFDIRIANAPSGDADKATG